MDESGRKNRGFKKIISDISDFGKKSIHEDFLSTHRRFNRNSFSKTIKA